MRVLYSFPDTLGAPGIGTTARHQVEGLLAQGIEVSVWCTSIRCELPRARRVVTTLSAAGVRVPHRALGGDRAYRYHDLRVAAALKRRAGEFDVVHVWPRAALHTRARPRAPRHPRRPRGAEHAHRLRLRRGRARVRAARHRAAARPQPHVRPAPPGATSRPSTTPPT